jgi:hypothetical protein
MSFLENQYYLDVASSTNFKLPEKYQRAHIVEMRSIIPKTLRDCIDGS